jgi:hypothetical protein
LGRRNELDRGKSWEEGNNTNQDKDGIIKGELRSMGGAR